MSLSQSVVPALPPEPNGPKISSTPCYTCRRRRVLCDKSLPTCQKCHTAQKTCLGYKKPLTWVQGVASRGKMMGLTFNDVAGDRRQAESPCSTDVIDSAGQKYSRQSGNLPAEGSALNHIESVEVSRSSNSSIRHQLLESVSPSRAVGVHGGGTVQQLNTRVQKFDNTGHVKTPNSLFVPRSLTDPSCQGLDSLSRHYLNYCSYFFPNSCMGSFANMDNHKVDQRFCKLMVLYEIPHSNPYRNLLQMVSTSPSLCATIAAIGAFHSLYTVHHQNQPSNYHHAPRLTCLTDDHEEFARSPNSVVRTNYRHALMFKQRALQSTKRSLSDPRTRGQEATIASVVLLVVLDMVESGGGAWKMHVDGAKSLLQARLGLLSGDVDTSRTPSWPCATLDSLSMCLVGTCMTYVAADIPSCFP